MIRSELILRLAERFPQFIQKDVELVVGEILGAIHDALAAQGRVEIRGFGSFCLNYRPPRNARNPMTGEPVQAPGKRMPHFMPGKELRERVSLSEMLCVRHHMSARRSMYSKQDKQEETGSD